MYKFVVVVCLSVFAFLILNICMVYCTKCLTSQIRSPAALHGTMLINSSTLSYMQVNIDKCLLSLSEIPMQETLLKCTETMSWLCNGLAGMVVAACRGAE